MIDAALAPPSPIAYFLMRAVKRRAELEESRSIARAIVGCIRAGCGRQSAVPTGSPACHSERPKGLASRRSEESVPPAARGKK